MKVKGSVSSSEESVIGSPGQGEFMFILIPSETYRLMLERARRDGCQISDCFQRAILQFLEPPKNRAPTVPSIKPNLVLKKTP